VDNKVLLVDDEPRVLSGLTRILKGRFDLTCAGSGAEALDRIDHDGPFAAVVSDMRMPGMDGVELMREIRRRSPDTVRMILSGQSDMQAVISAINDGAVFRFHTKPVPSEVLLESLEAALILYHRQKRLTNADVSEVELVREALELRQGIAEGQLRMFLQPQAMIPDGPVRGAEALVRWLHPEHGLLLPGHFLGVAEATGLVEDITEWMIGAACREAALWHAQGRSPLRIAVNITAHDLAKPAFVTFVRDTLAQYGITPDWLELELTEGTAVQNLDRAAAVVRELAELGIPVSIDDFGTGYSSLGWLKHFPVSKLKIDRSFVVDIVNSAEALRFFATIVNLARDLNVNTLVEGVESREQMELVHQCGCGLVQGFLLAEPMSPEDFRTWIDDWPAGLL
jgi:EAL domain-containing protein (putative c-di-GMP-specific phosphodiesterase class I)/FixJ family two-component response regulator